MEVRSLLLILVVIVAITSANCEDDEMGGVGHEDGSEVAADEGGEMMMMGRGEMKHKKMKSPKKKMKKMCKMHMDEESCNCKKIETALGSINEMIKELKSEVREMKGQMSSGCSENNGTDIGSMEKMDEKMNTTDLDETDVDSANDTDTQSTTVSSIPTKCDLPFQLLAEGCFFFLYYPEDWKSWGDAHAYCQSLGGVLASPTSLTALRNYMIDNFSNVFWIGAQRTNGEKEYKWFNGETFPEAEWATGQPSKSGAKNCIVLESISRYKAMNNYCGEKFPFICQRKQT